MKQESPGNNEDGIGENRVSSKAEFKAYVERPDARGSASNVPMHPRSDLWPERESVFQVTKRGYVSVTESRDAYDGWDEATEVALEGVVKCEVEEVVDIMDGEEVEEDREDEVDACNRAILGS